MNALVPIETSNAEIYRASTDAAGLCKEIVVASAMEIDRRKYVKVEGWQAIAIAHGCTGSAGEVERIPGGVRAIGQVRRMSDGAVIAEAEGFVGEDEPTWFGGEIEVNEWVNGRKTGKRIRKTLAKRPDYAIRAMAQTRAISRACRSAFAHVVVMMNAGLSTTPAEEVPLDGFDDRQDTAPRNVTPAAEKVEKIDLGAEMDACKTKGDLLAWEQRRLKEIGRLSKAEGDPLAKKFSELLDRLPEDAPASSTPAPTLTPAAALDISEDEVPY
jgi:hypothetical protein